MNLLACCLLITRLELLVVLKIGLKEAKNTYRNHNTPRGVINRVVDMTRHSVLRRDDPRRTAHGSRSRPEVGGGRLARGGSTVTGAPPPPPAVSS